MAWGEAGRGAGGRARALPTGTLAAALAVVLLLLVPSWGGSPSAAAAGPPELTRYSLAGGCFALRSEQTGGYVAKGGGGYTASGSSASAAEPFRMQATDLGRYLFYGPAKDFLARRALLGGVAPAATPSDDSDWTVTEDGSAFRIVNEHAGRDLAVDAGGALVTVPGGSAGAAGRFSFDRATGCATYPEVEVNVEGAPRTGSTPYSEVVGLVEGHLHHMAFEFLGGGAHCGQPWHRFGAPFALTDCADHTLTNGCGAVLENVLYGNPARCHDPGGWPGFAGWPDPKSLTHEQTYYRWVERAWRGGLRIFVNLLVENRSLCEIYPLPATGKNSCDEMDSVRLQARRAHELEGYIDAQNGGPGKGWYRIVDDPFEAREVINQGKLAVILGMEVSEPFGCRFAPPNHAPQCTAADVDAGIDEIYGLGIRQVELINKFDNPLAGVAGDSGETGVITNAGNFASTGRFWDLEHCDDEVNHDHSPSGVHNVDESLANGLSGLLPGAGTLPVYPSPPHCNRMGLSDLGERAVRRLISKGMIFDPDHMSVNARNRALDVVESVRYPGVISSHSWSTDNALPRIYALGGTVTPYAGSSEGFVDQWHHIREQGYDDLSPFFGIGYGADMNGFGAQGGPRGAELPNPVRYPFRSFDGSATIDQQRSGQRSFDINTDGVAHYGLYPDWIEDLRMVAGDEIIRDMSRGAEAYLQMWERAVGVPGPGAGGGLGVAGSSAGCGAWPRRLDRGGLGIGLRLGDDPRTVLYGAGQPERRGRAWQWCAQGARGKKARVVAVFDESERVALVASTVARAGAGKLVRGAAAKELPGRARRVGGGIWARRAGPASRFFYRVRRGRIAYIGVADRSVARKGALAEYLALAGLP
jgi:hypothetical protein